MKIAAIPLPDNMGNLEFPTSIFGSGATVRTIMEHFLTWGLGFAGIVAVAAIVYSGIMYISAGGDEDKAKKAKQNLTWAIIGVALVILASVIVAWVNAILKSNP